MSLTAAAWEHTLIDWAYEGLNGPPIAECGSVSAPALRKAYGVCRGVTRAHSRTFYLASGLLSPAKRWAVRALYALCRITDDLVDAPTTAAPVDALGEWRRRVLEGRPTPANAVVTAWINTQSTYHIPRRYTEQLFDGVQRDLAQSRYDTFDDLAAYCYGVASTVGLMAMHIVGFEGPHAIPYAVRLGVALQLTNILRDIGEDWRAGRLYLPREELEHFGVAEEDIASARIDERWQALMRFEIDRVRTLYAAALPGVGLLHPDGRLAIAAAAELYQAILDDIEEHAFDVFARLAHTASWEKLQRLPGIWWRARLGYAGRQSAVGGPPEQP